MIADITKYFTFNEHYATLKTKTVTAEETESGVRINITIEGKFTGAGPYKPQKSSKDCYLVSPNKDLTLYQTSTMSPLKFYIDIPESAMDSNYLTVFGDVWGSSRQFTFSCKKLKLTKQWFNNQPTINGELSKNVNLGNKNQPFVISYEVNDKDLDDILTVKEYINGSLYNERINAIRNYVYEFEVDRELLNSFETGTTNIVSISVSDGKIETTNNYRFVKTNIAPIVEIITTIDKDLEYNQTPPSIMYRAYDPEGENITQTIYIDNVKLSIDNVNQNEDLTATISHDDWIRIKNGKHLIKLCIEDALGAITENLFPFTKNETVIDFEFKEPVETSQALVKYYNIISKMNINDNSVKVYVTNNAFDTAPTWEEMTSMPHTFTNTSKTADKWGFNLRVVVERNTEEGLMKLYGIGGSLI